MSRRISQGLQSIGNSQESATWFRIEPDDRFLLREEFLRGISKLHAFDLSYDILIYPKQLPAALEFAAHFPQQRLVLDHLAKPLVREQTLEPWKSQMRELAKAPNVLCKVSGLVTEASHTSWKPDDFRPFLDVVFEEFGADRLMFGSDWPVCLLAASYRQVFELIATYTAGLSEESLRAIFAANAAAFYRTDPGNV